MSSVVLSVATSQATPTWWVHETTEMGPYEIEPGEQVRVDLDVVANADAIPAQFESNVVVQVNLEAFKAPSSPVEIEVAVLREDQILESHWVALTSAQPQVTWSVDDEDAFAHCAMGSSCTFDYAVEVTHTGSEAVPVTLDLAVYANIHDNGSEVAPTTAAIDISAH